MYTTQHWARQNELLKTMWLENVPPCWTLRTLRFVLIVHACVTYRSYNKQYSFPVHIHRLVFQTEKHTVFCKVRNKSFVYNQMRFILQNELKRLDRSRLPRSPRFDPATGPRETEWSGTGAGFSPSISVSPFVLLYKCSIPVFLNLCETAAR